MYLKSAPAALTGFTTFAVLASAYLLFAGTFSLSEGFAALPAVAAGLAVATLYHRHAQRELTVHPPGRRLATAVFLSLIRDSLTVGGTLLRALATSHTGKISVQPFKPGAADARDAGRRAAVILATSLAPNAYVIRVTPEALLMHQLVPAPDQPDETWPL
jgi:hypothetical protein